MAQHSEPVPGGISDLVIPAAPVLALVVITLCVMVIYGISAHSDYSRSA
jgi:hypothetical protein